MHAPRLNVFLLFILMITAVLLTNGCSDDDDNNPVTPAGEWSWSPLGAGLNNTVVTAGVYDNLLIVGGSFTTAGDTAATRIASWNGSTWAPLGSGLDNGPICFSQWDNKLIVAGNFVTAGGVTVNHVGIGRATCRESE